MGRTHAGRALVVQVIAAVLLSALAGASVLSLVAPELVEAQTEPNTAANGIVLPPLGYDPVAARNEDATGSATAPGTPTPTTVNADGTTTTDAPESGNSVTTILGGSDVAVSSVGGSYEVDRPSKRSRKK
jgi:hypothetical protein